MAAWCGALVLGLVITQVVGRNAELQALPGLLKENLCGNKIPQVASMHVNDVEGHLLMAEQVEDVGPLAGGITLDKLLNLSGPPCLPL